MTNETHSSDLQSNRVDGLVSLAKGVVGAAPYAGAILAEVVGQIIPNQRIDRIAAFVRLLDERVQHIEKDRLEDRFRQPEVVDVLEDAFTQAARATTHDRLEHIANVVANGISAEELKETATKRMLWILSHLSDSEVILLRSKLASVRSDFQKDAEFREQHADVLSPDVTDTGSTEDEFEEAALNASYRQHLHDLGLTRLRFSRPKRGEVAEMDGKTGMMKASGTDITRLGRMLLRSLNLIPDWYQR